MRTSLIKTKSTLASLALFFVVAVASPEVLFAKSSARNIADFIMVDNVKIVKARVADDFSLAAYNETETTVALQVAASQFEELYYLEPSDVGALVVAYELKTGLVRTLISAHEISCADIRRTFSSDADITSVCR